MRLLLITGLLFFSSGICAQNDTLYLEEEIPPIAEQRKMWEYDQWPQMFKDRALCLCLLQGYPPAAAEQIKRADRSYYDAVGFTFFDSTIHELLKKEMADMKADSARSHTSLPEPRGGKKDIFGRCMEFYRSNRLEQAMQTARRRWEQVTDILGEIHKVIPTY